MSYWSAVHDSATGTPVTMMLGHNLRLPADLVFGHPLGAYLDCPPISEQYVSNLQGYLDTIHQFATTNIQSTSNKRSTTMAGEVIKPIEPWRNSLAIQP